MAIERLANHTVWLMERGGKRRFQEITDIAQLSYSRVRDDISTAQIIVSANDTSQQADLLRQLIYATGRYEICVWRGDLRVWEGPITLVTFRKNGVEIEARDVMHYTARLWLSKEYDDRYPNTNFVVSRAVEIMQHELARKDTVELALGLPSVNVLPHIVEHHFSTDAQTSRYTFPYQYTVYEHIDDLAAKAGMDYTALGRAVHFWDTSRPVMGYTETATESDFLGELYVSVYGMELGTVAGVTDGQGVIGVAGEADPYYGLVERLDTAYDEDATAPPTVAQLASQAQRNLAGRMPTPLQVRVPDNSGINLDGIFSIENLIPGVYIPVITTIGLVEVSQMQKLNNMKVQETPDGETVQVTLYPATKADEEDVEP